MDPQMMQWIITAISVFAAALVSVALFVLWMKSRSQWLLLAIVSQCVSLLFLLANFVVPRALTIIPIIPMIWSITGLLAATGLLGYALDESKRRGPSIGGAKS